MAVAFDSAPARDRVDAAAFAQALDTARARHAALPRDAAFTGATGWLDPAASAVQMEAVRAKGAEIADRADTFILVGVGGSNQAARAVIESMPGRTGPRVVYAGNTLSAERAARLAAEAADGSVYINVIAKNFATLEPGVHYRLLRQVLGRRYTGREWAERIVLTGTRGSRLEAVARENGHLFLEFPETVGGRFSALTPVGLLPIAAAGLDADACLRGAVDMAAALRRDPTPAAAYAALRHCLYQAGTRVELLAAFEPRLSWFGRWWLQLFGESEGKDGKGLFPACADYSEDLHAIGQYVQEGTKQLMETFLTVADPGASYPMPPDPEARDGFDYLTDMDLADINRAAETATVAAHDAGGVPCCRVDIDRLDEEHFGRLFFFFMTACALSALLLEVNPFDQEGVEQYKQRMFAALGRDAGTG